VCLDPAIYGTEAATAYAAKRNRLASENRNSSFPQPYPLDFYCGSRFHRRLPVSHSFNLNRGVSLTLLCLSCGNQEI
jgi:hypothetical protein